MTREVQELKESYLVHTHCYQASKCRTRAGIALGPDMLQPNSKQSSRNLKWEALSGLTCTTKRTVPLKMCRDWPYTTALSAANTTKHAVIAGIVAGAE